LTHQEKRNRNLLIILIALSAITVGYYWFAGRAQSVVDSTLFQVADLTVIDRVLLEQEGEQIDLNYDGTRWLVNNELADRNMIDVLFATLQQARPVRPVAKALRDSVRRMVENNGVKVSLFAEGKPELTFLAGGNARKTQAWFKKEKSDESYMMAIPGYRVYVSGIFELDKAGWKDKYVFQLNWRNFQSLEARFPQSPDDDFDVRFRDGYFSIEGLANVDTTKLNDFLDAVSLLTVNEYRKVNSAEAQQADSSMIILVRDVAGKQYRLDLHGAPGQAGPVTGTINGLQPAVFDRKKLEPILRGRNFFRLD
jgi:hypothetical protein